MFGQREFDSLAGWPPGSSQGSGGNDERKRFDRGKFSSLVNFLYRSAATRQ
jgi:hypothetical protein